MGDHQTVGPVGETFSGYDVTGLRGSRFAILTFRWRRQERATTTQNKKKKEIADVFGSPRFAFLVVLARVRFLRFVVSSARRNNGANPSSGGGGGNIVLAWAGVDLPARDPKRGFEISSHRFGAFSSRGGEADGFFRQRFAVTSAGRVGSNLALQEVGWESSGPVSIGPLFPGPWQGVNCGVVPFFVASAGEERDRRRY